MSASGNRPTSVSPPLRPRTNTQWQTTTAPPPQPLSPLANSRQQHATNATTTANGDNDISLRHILDRYKDDPELLKHILKAKVEEDKKQTTVETIKVEQARIHLRELDIELLREQNKISSGYYDKHPQQPLPGLPSTSLHPPTTVPTGIANSSSSSSNGSGYTLAAPNTDGTPYHGLAPVQQQVLARITGESATTANSNHYSHNNHYAGNNHSSYQHPVIENGHATESTLAPPRSPVAYPHSAHPLCPPSEPHPYRNNSSSTTSWSYRQRFYPRNSSTHQPTTPISPGIGDTRDQPPSLPPPSSSQQQQQQHDIQKKRARSSATNDGGEHTDNITHDQVMEALKAKIQRGNNDRSKRARIPSPRSSKPILPPIDTSVGRIPSSSSSSSVAATAPLPSTTSPNTTTTTTTTTDHESKQQSTRPTNTTSDTSSSPTVATEST